MSESEQWRRRNYSYNPRIKPGTFDYMTFEESEHQDVQNNISSLNSRVDQLEAFVACVKKNKTVEACLKHKNCQTTRKSKH